MRALSLSLLCAQWLLPLALGKGLVTHDSTFVPDYVLRVSAQNIYQACDERYSAVINGSSPGPTIRIPQGKAAWIRVYNDMPDHNLTMHWHGLSQSMAQFSDGAVMATSWPIAPMAYVDQEIEALEVGTYFYHSHVGTQALTAFGAIIIQDCNEPPYKYDDERILLWSEHYKQNDSTFEAGLLAAPLRFGGEVQGVLLNGHGVAINHTAGDVPEDPSCQLPLIEVEPDKTYRFRFIGATSLAYSVVAFEGHDNLTIIAVDGSEYTKPTLTDRIQLGSGQRYDVLFKTKSQAELDAEGKTVFFFQFETRDRPAVFQGFGGVKYTTRGDKGSSKPLKAPEAPVLTIPTNTSDWIDGILEPLHPHPDFPTLKQVTRRLILEVVQLTDPVTKQIIWQMNGLNWNELIARPVPLLVDIYRRGEAAVPDYDAAMANRGWDPKTLAFPAKTGEVLEIVLQNTGSAVNNSGGVDVHPFHLHGTHFFFLASGPGIYDAEATEKARIASGRASVKRDTVMLHRDAPKTAHGKPSGWTTLRIHVKNPGVWMLHCHVLQHMMMGMQLPLVFGNASEVQKIPTELSEGYFTYGGNVTGNATTDPQVYEQFDHNKMGCNATTHY